MHHIQRIEVDGFWDTHKVAVDIHDDVTFFIGENGTGKTTLINIIAAALTADFATLEKLPFKKITIFLAPNSEGRRPIIAASKNHKKDRSIDFIEYKIRKDENDPEVKYSLDEGQERVWLRRVEAGPRYVQDFYRHFSHGLLSELSSLVKVDWLSVHRTPNLERLREERTYESTVDRRLETISNDLVRYFASLSKLKDEQVRAFQEFIFVSLLEQPSDYELFRSRRKEKLADDKQAMFAIFKELRVSRPNVSELIESFYSRAERLFARTDDRGITFSPGDLSIFASARRIDAVVDQWKQRKKAIETIFAQRDKFVRITNGLLQRKQLELSDSDELVFISRTKKKLTPQMLSSGEKQLLILLSEALLQRQTPSILIADEPELSLHVRWQERLVPSLRELNSNSQIIAATHSPDIVGPLGDKTIDMESIIP